MELLAHTGGPLRPHDLWAAWGGDPLALAGLLAAWWVYHRGLAGRPRRRQAMAFSSGLVAAAAAVLSPLDALAGSLASAHMVQHLLLVLVAAPLLAVSRPLETMWRGMPAGARRWVGRRRRSAGLTPAVVRRVPLPGVVWIAHVAALWGWHAAGPYQAALRMDLVHGLEHASFLVTGTLFWWVALRVLERGAAVLYVFTAALQGTVLAALLTFATTPWYPSYAATAPAWGLTPLADQQLAGVLMWVPGGLVYVAAGLGLVVAWLRELDAEARCRDWGRSKDSARDRRPGTRAGRGRRGRGVPLDRRSQAADRAGPAGRRGWAADHRRSAQRRGVG